MEILEALLSDSLSAQFPEGVKGLLLGASLSGILERLSQTYRLDLIQNVCDFDGLQLVENEYRFILCDGIELQRQPEWQKTLIGLNNQSDFLGIVIWKYLLPPVLEKGKKKPPQYLHLSTPYLRLFWESDEIALYISDQQDRWTLSVITPNYNSGNLIFRALESIPERDDIEVIICDDASTDQSYAELLKYISRRRSYSLLHHRENRGVGYTRNCCLNVAQGEYIVFLDSDDYFLPQFEEILFRLGDADMIYYNLKTNMPGRIYDINITSRRRLCGTVKCIRRALIGQTRFPLYRVSEDRFFNNILLSKKPSELFTGIPAAHYDHPRAGSLTSRR